MKRRGTILGGSYRTRPTPARGSALVYLTVTMVALVAFSSLAVDLGRVQVVRGELQLAADAAARHAAVGLEAGIASAQANAVDAANDNKADGTTVVLDPNTDVEFGTWTSSTKTFTVLTGSARSGADAIRVTARRTAATGNAVSLLFARVIGRSTCDVRATSVAYYKAGTALNGIAGLSGVTMKNNTFIGSYNSATTKTPTEATATSAATLYSNGTITGSNNSDLGGNVVLGPTAPNVSGVSITGTTSHTSTALVPPVEPAWTPAANPGGIPQNYTASGNVTLPAGNYWFTSLTVNGTLSFSGAATLVVNGDIEVGGTLQAYNLIPGNLKVRQIGAHTFGDDKNNGMNLVADIEAPNSDFVVKNNLTLRGRLIAKTIELKNNADLFYDVSLTGTGGAGTKVTTVR